MDHVPPGEDEAIARIIELARQQILSDYADIRPALRDQHPKSHGCLRAEFEVAANIPQPLRHGIFSEPKTYPAWVRFSSSSSKPRPDSKRDAHGLALKLMSVPGEKILTGEQDATTQDFIVANNPVFFCRNAIDYVELATRMLEGNLLKFFFGANPFKWRVHEFLNLVAATQKKVLNPLQIRYWSQTPSALGPHTVKYAVTPSDLQTESRRISNDFNFLEEAIDCQLTVGETSFDFAVQLQIDPRSMPVEDPTVLWKESRSPFQKVATIRIAPQDFRSRARRNFAEQLSFTPSHSLPEHRPLGGINRARAAVYEAISELRHELNDVERREPTAQDGI